MLGKAGKLRRIVSIIFIVLLFSGLSVFASNIQSVKAQYEGTIVINPDGSISSPVPANISMSDYVTYTFTGNNSLPIIVNRSNIIINGRGYTLQAPGSDGFTLSSVKSVTIENTIVTKCHDGIDLDNSSNNVLTDNTIKGSSEWGCFLYSSSDNALSGNVMTNNTYNFGVYGFALSDFVNYVDTSNLVDGKPVCYLMNTGDIAINPQTYPKGVGYLALVNCKNVTVQDLALRKNFPGLLLANTNDSRITDNNITASSNYGIYVSNSSGNVLSGNNITANDAYGIFAYSSNNNTFSDNIATSDYGGGIALDNSSRNIVSENYLASNTGGGVDLFSSSGNRIFHNDFLNNVPQAQASSDSSNAWDDGYPSGGNYWSNYQTRYPSAIANDSSAIWNTPYNISSGNIDRYPLMGSFDTFSMGTWNSVAYSVDTVSNSTLSNFSFNASAKTLTFNATGQSGTTGFCRVAIPKDFMWCDNQGQWLVIITEGSGSQFHYLLLTPNIMIDTNYTYLYFNYTHSTHSVLINSTHAVPEFQPFMLLPMFMIITLLGAMAFKKKESLFCSTTCQKTTFSE